MSQNLTITRLGDQDNYPGIWPTLHAGIDEGKEGFYDENAKAEVSCESDLANIGDTTSCIIKARIRVDYVENSFWSLHVDNFAAWPGQETVARD